MPRAWPGSTAVLVALLAAACSTSTGDPSRAPSTSTSPVRPTTPSTTTSTTSVPAAAPEPIVRLVLDPIEARAATGGVHVRADLPGGSVRLSAEAPVAEVALAGSRELRFSYQAPDGTLVEPDWVQRIDPADEEVTVRQPWRSEGSSAEVLLAWQALGDRDTYLDQLEGAPGLTVTSPVWWWVRADGTFGDDADPAFVTAAQALGVEVWPAVAGFDEEVLGVAFGDPELRRRLVEGLASRAAQIGADGINIDAEGYRIEDAEAVSTFVEELAAAVRRWGGTISVDLVPRSDDWDVAPSEFAHWSLAPQRRRLSAAVDYVVLMAYDQYNRRRPFGPVASPAWVEEVLRYQLRFTDPHRLILGVPLYGRIWDPEEPEKPRAVGIGYLESVAEGGTRGPDERFGVDRVDLSDGRFLWLETAQGLRHRVDLVEDLGLAGLAAWRLGFDHGPVWEVLAGE